MERAVQYSPRFEIEVIQHTTLEGHEMDHRADPRLEGDGDEG